MKYISKKLRIVAAGVACLAVVVMFSSGCDREGLTKWNIYVTEYPVYVDPVVYWAEPVAVGHKPPEPLKPFVKSYTHSNPNVQGDINWIKQEGEYTYADDGKAINDAIEQYRKNGPDRGGGSGSNLAMCKDPYVDPVGGDIQSNSFCAYAWGYICEAGYSPSAKEVKDLCDTFRAWQSRNSGLGNCKYCQ